MIAFFSIRNQRSKIVTDESVKWNSDWQIKPNDKQLNTNETSWWTQNQKKGLIFAY